LKSRSSAPTWRHQVFAGGEHRVGKHWPPVFGDDHEVSVQRIDSAGAPLGVALRVSADLDARASMGADSWVWKPVIVGVGG
jgi:hypothetical protein